MSLKDTKEDTIGHFRRIRLVVPGSGWKGLTASGRAEKEVAESDVMGPKENDLISQGLRTVDTACNWLSDIFNTVIL